MAVLETHIFKAHNNIYIEQPEENYRTREIRTEIVFPDCVNENTGMLVLIPGYGGNIDSHVFRKMREVFAEQYNCRLPRLLTQQGLTTIERVDDAG